MLRVGCSNLGDSDGGSNAANDDSRLSFQIERLLIADCGVAAHLLDFEADLPLDGAGHGGEKPLARFVRRSGRPDLVDPLVLGIVVDDKLFHESEDGLGNVAARDGRRREKVNAARRMPISVQIAKEIHLWIGGGGVWK